MLHDWNKGTDIGANGSKILTADPEQKKAVENYTRKDRHSHDIYGRFAMKTFFTTT